MPPEPSRGQLLAYLATIAAVGPLLAAAVIALNFAVDPLWFGAGNRLGDRNLVYNERISKLNLFLQDPRAYDCAIFGDSRVSLLDPNRIEGHRCFNHAVAAANLIDTGALAEFVAARSGRVELVVLGLGLFNFADHPLPDHTPRFLQGLEERAGAWQAYASLPVALFSLESVLGNSRTPLYYRSDFTADILDDPGAYDTNPALAREAWDFFMTRGPFSTDELPLLRRVQETFPEARQLAYVPPVAADYIAELARAGTLESYLDVIFAISRQVEALHDFSIPSETTADPSRTLDGQHFLRSTNDRVAAVLSGSRVGFGVPVHTLDRASYGAAYRAALARFTEVGDAAL